MDRFCDILDIVHKESKFVSQIYHPYDLVLIRPYVFSKTLIKLYYSLIFPHLIYGIESWGYSSILSTKPLITLQKRAVRLITFKDKRQTDYSLPASNPLFKNLKILKFPDIATLYISRFVFRCLN